MLNAIRDLLPVAMAVALSPFPIVAIVLVLATPRAIAAGLAFSLGWTLGLAALSTLLFVAAQGETADGLGGWAQIAVALALFIAALRKWKKRPRAGQTAQIPSWMAALDTITPTRAMLVGAGLGGLNPKNIGLAFAAVSAIAAHPLDRRESALCIGIFTLLGSTTVLGALLTRMIGGQRAAAPLDRLKRFMTRNNAVIMMVVFLLIGAKLFGEGLVTLIG